MDRALLQEAAKAAVECEKATGLPAELTVAQWALESGWGFHSPGNNCFGIKAHPTDGQAQLLSTTEWFGPGMADLWVANRQGRTAVLIEGVEADAKGRRKYACKDWFAAYSSLTDCFEAHANVFTRGMLGNCLGTYKIDRDLYKFINTLAPVYATDPQYADKVLSIIGKAEVVDALKTYRLVLG